MNAWEILFAVGSGLAINEMCELSPWAARKLASWSAHLRYGNGRRAEVRAEEWAALVADRPGKLFKLITALWLVVAAVPSLVARSAKTAQRWARFRTGLRRLGVLLGLLEDAEDLATTQIISVGPTGKIEKITVYDPELLEQQSQELHIGWRNWLRELDQAHRPDSSVEE